MGIQRRGHYDEPDAPTVMRHILEGVEFMHGRGIIHRDLKPENIILVCRDSDVDAKVCDFGIAKLGELNSSGARCAARSRSFKGSDYFLAPELIYQKEYGSEVDIWAIGVISYAVLSGGLPFVGEDLRETYRQITECKLEFEGQVWEEKSDLAVEFITDLLCIDTDRRPTAPAALLHPWVLQLYIDDGDFDDINDDDEECAEDNFNCYAC